MPIELCVPLPYAGSFACNEYVKYDSGSQLEDQTSGGDRLRKKLILACTTAIRKLSCTRFFTMAVAIDQNHGFKPFRLHSSNYDYHILELTQTSHLSQSLKHAFEVANIHKSFSTPCLSQAATLEEEFDTTAKVEILGGRRSPRVRALVVEVAIALASGADPIPVSSGLGGAYLLHSRNGDKIGVVKPVDEEPLAINNPKGFGGLMLGQPGLKRSVRVGETGIRELAAYLLDHAGFAGVPPTSLIKIAHVGFHVSGEDAFSAPPHKIASLQRFVDHDFDAAELGASCFTVASVHQIGILDVRLLNLDRHAGNLLVRKKSHCENNAVGSSELVPIDHGFCLPEWLDDPYFEWLHWPQASIPFSESELEYISNLDPYKDADLLRNELPSLGEPSTRILVLCTVFLKQAAAAGLCLAEIGKIMTREFRGGVEKPSVLENLCAQAKASVITTCKADGEDDDSNSEQSEVQSESEMFLFDHETIDSPGKVFDLGQLLECPPGIAKLNLPGFTSTKSMPKLHDLALSPLYEENGDFQAMEEGIDSDESEDGDSKVACLLRSVSYSIHACPCETEGISLGDLNEVEWGLFMDDFEKLLPEVFEGIKNMGLKQRLGTSCEF